MMARMAAWLPAVFLLAGCASSPAGLRITVVNELAETSRHEVVSVPWSEVARVLPDLADPEDAAVEDGESGALLVTQLVDRDGDGAPEELLFPVDVAGGEERRFLVRPAGDIDVPAAERSTFGRYVPERMDDFAWENDVVAFRMYGPALSADAVDSGVDCWLKRVDYPIIDKWYRGDQEGVSYHQDHGEGYDPYHVGGSRGCGGLAVWSDGRMHPSDVYAEWRMLANGPLRTEFELRYDPWTVDGREIAETKRISIDVGQSFSRFESRFLVDGTPARVDLAVGLTTHGAAAAPVFDPAQAWLSCWELIDGDHLGTGVVFDPERLAQVLVVEGEGPDDGHVLALVSTDDEGRLSYAAGYGWSRAGVVREQDDWRRVLAHAARCARSPLRVVLGDE